MKKILLYVSVLCISSCFAQGFSGEILYNKRIHSEDLQKTNTAVLRNMQAIANASEGLTYVLTFNSEASMFQLEEIASRDSNRSDSRAISMGGGKGVYYKNINSGKTLRQMEFFGQDFIVEIPDSKYQWEVTGDTKKIGNYTVRKAVTSYLLKAPHEELEDKVVYLEAWFTSEIPISFGPREIGGLPGLVLEFTSGKVTYRAYQISLDTEAEVASGIDSPSQGTIVTEEQLAEIGKKMMERMRN